MEDEKGTIYNVEVQTTDKRNLPRRMRYYQSMIDIHVLHPGDDYRNLRKSFVIFICNYDPFGRNRYIYTFETVCREVPGLSLGDDTYKIVVNTAGQRWSAFFFLKLAVAQIIIATSAAVSIADHSSAMKKRNAFAWIHRWKSFISGSKPHSETGGAFHCC